jgi:hypothetical protein
MGPSKLGMYLRRCLCNFTIYLFGISLALFFRRTSSASLGFVLRSFFYFYFHDFSKIYAGSKYFQKIYAGSKYFQKQPPTAVLKFENLESCVVS